MSNEWRDLPTMADVAAAMDVGDEIQVDGYSGWEEWYGTMWALNMQYRARPRQPKMKKVKLLCWFNGEDLFWKPEDHPVVHWQRFPAGDIEGEVEE